MDIDAFSNAPSYPQRDYLQPLPIRQNYGLIETKDSSGLRSTSLIEALDDFHTSECSRCYEQEGINGIYYAPGIYAPYSESLIDLLLMSTILREEANIYANIFNTKLRTLNPLTEESEIYSPTKLDDLLVIQRERLERILLSFIPKKELLWYMNTIIFAVIRAEDYNSGTILRKI